LVEENAVDTVPTEVPGPSRATCKAPLRADTGYAPFRGTAGRKPRCQARRFRGVAPCVSQAV